MLTFDTLKFVFPQNQVKRIAKNFFEKKIVKSPRNDLVSSLETCRQPIEGLKAITLDKCRESVSIEVSAKILGNSYLEGIHQFNFTDVLDTIKKTDLIYFRNSDVLQSSVFCRVDCTKNISVNSEIQKYIQSLSYLSNSNKFHSQNYHNNSVTFSYNPISKRRRLRFIFYDKYKEVSKSKKFHKLFDIEKAKNILRYEINLNNFFLIRKYLNLSARENLGFSNVICNDTNIFKNVFELLLSNTMKSSNLDYDFLNSHKLSDVEKYFGRVELCKNFDFDFKKITIFLKSKVKGNITKYLNVYRDVCLTHSKIQTIKKQNILINQIYENVA